MKKNRFSDEMIEKSEAELRNYLDNTTKFQEDVVIAARWELENRGLIEPSVEEPNESGSKLNIDLNFHSAYNEYPPKPLESTGKQSLQRSVVSLVVFILAFYLLFDWEILNIIVLAAVIIIHELGHYLAMRIFKYKDLSIFFIPLVGAMASGNKDTISQKQHVIILLAGPVPGIIIGLIINYFGLKYTNGFMNHAAAIFILINLFNLLPIIPLDGGRLIKTLFFESNEIINNIFIYLSIAALSYFAISTRSYFLLIVPFFLFMQLTEQKILKKVRAAALKKGVNLNKSYTELSDKEYWLIRDAIALAMKQFNKLIEPGNYTISIIEDRIVKQVKAILQKQPVKDLGIFGKIVITFFWLLLFIVPLFVIAFYYLQFGIEI